MRRILASMLNALYVRSHRRIRPFGRARLAAWELPITVARLFERIQAEEAYLLARVRRLIASTCG